MKFSVTLTTLALLTAMTLRVQAADADPAQTVSFSRQVVPIFKEVCNGCHRPGKTKGKLDLTSYDAVMRGGKHGPLIDLASPAQSMLIEEVSGEVPNMPEDEDPLTPQQISVLLRWIEQGANDDTPDADSAPTEPPVYTRPPVISELAFSPDGKLLAVNGIHEVVLHAADGGKILGRLVGAAARIESIAFSDDGKRLGVAGGSPGQFGHVQVWSLDQQKPIQQVKVSHDSLFGLSFSPDGKTLAVGGADKSVRQIRIEDGQVLQTFKAHTDWVLGTTFAADGKQLVTAGRDKAMKLMDLETGRFVDDINNPVEAVVCFARHPHQPQVAYGGDMGTAHLYRISDNQKRTAGRNDTNLVRKFERQPSTITAIAFSPDGKQLAIGSDGRVVIYDLATGAKKATLPGHTGPIYAIAYSPDGQTIATGGFEGKIRYFDPATGKQTASFDPVPIQKVAHAD